MSQSVVYCPQCLSKLGLRGGVIPLIVCRICGQCACDGCVVARLDPEAVFHTTPGGIILPSGAA